MIRSHVRCVAFRLLSGEDLVGSLRERFSETGSAAACIVSCVGSLSSARIRYAGAQAGSPLQGPLELLSLSGTLSRDGVHLHVALADSGGTTKGGHVSEGCVVGTTMEVVVGLLPDMVFSRTPDPATGYGELEIRSREVEIDPVLLSP